MKLSAEIKRMLNALAYANAAECLSLRNKTEILMDTPATKQQVTEPSPTQVVGPQVGLYMGSELHPDIMAYVIQTCARLQHGLTVLTLQSEADALKVIAPYETELKENGIKLRLIALTGEPSVALARALRRMPETAFLVCNEAGYLGHGFIHGSQRKDALPVPVVLVAPNGVLSSSGDKPAQRSHAA